MNIAVRKVHVVFNEYATSSPRFLAIAAGAALMHELQLDVYRMGARSATVVGNKARLARSFFMDLETYQWRADCITPFQIATWVHGRIAGGTKTAGIYAAATLRLVQAASEWIMHYTHPLVVGQIRSVVGGKSEPSVPARTPSVEILSKLEALVFTGATVQIRCLAGFFTLLAYGGARATNAQQSRNVRILGDSITGESIMKNKGGVWTKWFVTRHGLSGEWATHWLQLLGQEGLPGFDFFFGRRIQLGTHGCRGLPNTTTCAGCCISSSMRSVASY